MIFNPPFFQPIRSFSSHLFKNISPNLSLLSVLGFEIMSLLSVKVILMHSPSIYLTCFPSIRTSQFHLSVPSASYTLLPPSSEGSSAHIGVILLGFSRYSTKIIYFVIYLIHIPSHTTFPQTHLHKPKNLAPLF